MESDSRIGQWMSSVTDWLNEQVWFQELKTKWEELDPQSRTYLKFAAFGGTVALAIAIVLGSIWSVHSLRSELEEKQDLLSMIENANSELRRLREANAAAPASAQSGAQGGPWNTYLENLASTSAGIDKGSVTVSPEQAAKSESETVKEAMLDVSVKHVSIRQVVRYAYSLETGSRPVKLRSLMIDTKADPSGYLDATLSVSGFTMAANR